MEYEPAGDTGARSDTRLLRAPIETSARVLAFAAVVLVCTFVLVAVVEVTVVTWLIGGTPTAAVAQPASDAVAALQAPLMLLLAGAVGTAGACVLLLHLIRHWVRRAAVAAGAS